MGKLFHTEWYKLFHEKIFWIFSVVTVLFNILIFSGSSILNLSGHFALIESMKKEIATAIIACIYGGISLGGDFADRTFYHGLLTGKSRSSVIIAKSIVFALATDVLLLLFPFLLTSTCTIKNGWGSAVPAESSLHIVGILAALALLGFAVSSISLLAAVCFRDIGRTTGIPIVLYFVTILLLNSPYSSTFFRILPIGLMILAADGTVSPAYGALLGVLWFVLLSVVSTLIFRRAELR